MAKKTARIEDMTFTGAEFAELVGRSPATISTWKRQGLPVRDGKVLLKAGLQWFWSRELLAATGDGSSEHLERWRRIRADREQLALERDRADVVPFDEVNAFMMDRTMNIRQTLRGVPQSVAPACVGQPVHEVAALISDRLEAACGQIYTDWARTCGIDPEHEDTDDEANT